jgi:uncharacterized membrane protein
MKNTQENSLTNLLTNTQTNVGKPERVASAVGGGALIAYGLKRGGATGVILSLLGGSLALRGVTGHCQLYDALDIDTSGEGNLRSLKNRQTSSWLSGNVEVNKSVTINKPVNELFQFWRNFENLPLFMQHLESVEAKDNLYSHWKAKAPLGYTVEWDAEITNEVENSLIEWKSLENADIPNSGRVEFRPTADRGTEVNVHLTYQAPAGRIGSLVAKIFGEEPSQQVAEDLRRFKRLMEAGMNLKVEGQPSGRAEEAKKASA